MNDVSSNASPGTILDLVERVTILEFELKSIRMEQDEAKVSRRGMHDKLDTMLARDAETAETVKTLLQEVKEMKPTLTLHEQLRQQFKGALLIIGLIWSVALLSAGFVLRQLWVWVTTHWR